MCWKVGQRAETGRKRAWAVSPPEISMLGTGLKIQVILVWAVPGNWTQRWRELFPSKEKLGTGLKIRVILVWAVPENWTQDTKYLGVSCSPDKLWCVTRKKTLRGTGLRIWLSWCELLPHRGQYQGWNYSTKTYFGQKLSTYTPSIT